MESKSFIHPANCELRRNGEIVPLVQRVADHSCVKEQLVITVIPYEDEVDKLHFKFGDIIELVYRRPEGVNDLIYKFRVEKIIDVAMILDVCCTLLSGVDDDTQRIPIAVKKYTLGVHYLD